MDRLIAFLGIFILLLISYSLSNDRKKVDPKIIIWGLSLQFIFAILILRTPIGKPIFGFLDSAISKLIVFLMLEETFYLNLLYQMLDSIQQ